MSLVIPLYYGHRLGIGRQIATDTFYPLESHEVFHGQPASFDMFNILVRSTDNAERQIMRWPISICWHSSIANESVEFAGRFIYILSSRGISP